MTTRTHWHVLGAGAMGCLWTAALTRAGHPVTLLLRHGNIQQVRLQENGQWQTFPVGSRTTLPQRPITHLLVTTKAHQTLTALATWAPALQTGTRIVLMQNGLGQHDAVAQRFPSCHLHAGLCTEGAWRSDAVSVVHAGHGLTRLGRWPAPGDDEHRLMAAFSDVTLPVHWEPDIRPALWQKWAVNCTINPLTALYACCNGDLLDGSTRQQHLQTLCAEVDRVLQAEGFPCPHGSYALATAVAQATANNRSSLWQDVLAGRETEIHYLNGFLQQEADRLGIAVPANRAVLDAVLALAPPAA